MFRVALGVGTYVFLRRVMLVAAKIRAGGKEDQGAIMEVPYSTFLDDVAAGKVEAAVVGSDEIRYSYGDAGSKATDMAVRMTRPVQASQMTINALQKHKVEFGRAPPGILARALPIALTLAPIVYLGVLVGTMWKMWGDSIGKIGDAKAAQQDGDEDDGDHVGFGDAAGIDEAKDRVREIVDFIRNPEKYQRLGARSPKGLLLVGPPGTGKTLLARAIANEAGVPFFYCSGSDFVEMFAGRGAARVRALFEKAQRNSPSIVFVDEIDSLGKHRGDGVYSHEEREQTLNQMLACMDGFGTQNSRVVVIGATNRYDTLDRALTRPGRFDRLCRSLSLPSAGGRQSSESTCAM